MNPEIAQPATSQRLQGLSHYVALVAGLGLAFAAFAVFSEAPPQFDGARQVISPAKATPGLSMRSLTVYLVTSREQTAQAAAIEQYRAALIRDGQLELTASSFVVLQAGDPEEEVLIRRVMGNMQASLERIGARVAFVDWTR